MEKLNSVLVFLMHKQLLLACLIVVGCSRMRMSTFAQDIRIFPGKSSPTINIPSESKPLSSTAVLICGVEPTSPNITQFNYTSRWITPAGETVNFTNRRFSFFEGQAIINSSRQYPATILWVKMLSYRDAGVYSCQARTDAASPWVSTTIDLQLSLELQSTNSTVTTSTDSARTELSCEMSAFIRPDSSLTWKDPDGRKITTDRAMDKYQIRFSNGTSRRSANGTRELAPSRVSTLTIFNLEERDTGEYTCSVTGTGQSASVSLVVDSAANSADDVIATTTLMSDLLNTTAPLVSDINLTAVGAASVVTALALLVILITIAVTLRTLAYKNKRVYKTGPVVMSESNYVYPIYDYPTNILANLNNKYKTLDIENTDTNHKAGGQCQVGGHRTEDLHGIEAYAVSELNNEISHCNLRDDSSVELNDGSTDIVLERNEAYGEVMSRDDCGCVNDTVYAEIV